MQQGKRDEIASRMEWSIILIADTSRQREIVVDDFGVDLTQSALEDRHAVRAAFLEALRTKNRSHWIMGDLWAERSDDLSDLLDPTLLSLKTVENYASVCRAFPKRLRCVPLSMSHYQACARLVKVNPREALALLARAYDGGMSREWVRDESMKLLGETEVSIEVLITWDASNQVFIPNCHLEIPNGTTRMIRLKQ